MEAVPTTIPAFEKVGTSLRITEGDSERRPTASAAIDCKDRGDASARTRLLLEAVVGHRM